MEKIKIRQLSAADIEAVTRIYAEVFNPDYISFGELAAGLAIAPDIPSEQAATQLQNSLISQIDDERFGFFVASVGDDIVGFALASLHSTQANHTECWLDDLGVSLNYRRQGIAQKLVKHVLDWGTEKGAKYFLLESGINNKAAHHLFESEEMGFQPLAIVFWRSADASNK